MKKEKAIVMIGPVNTQKALQGVLHLDYNVYMSVSRHQGAGHGVELDRGTCSGGCALVAAVPSPIRSAPCGLVPARWRNLPPIRVGVGSIITPG